jgi:hypothetical protein
MVADAAHTTTSLKMEEDPPLVMVIAVYDEMPMLTRSFVGRSEKYAVVLAFGGRTRMSFFVGVVKAGKVASQHYPSQHYPINSFD